MELPSINRWRWQELEENENPTFIDDQPEMMSYQQGLLGTQQTANTVLLHADIESSSCVGNYGSYYAPVNCFSSTCSTDMETPHMGCFVEAPAAMAQHTSSLSFISFGKPDLPCDDDHHEDLVRVLELKEKKALLRGSKKVETGSTSSPCAQEHVMAERKRRERLSKQFMELTAIIPGLKKKIDKASVLGDTINYVKDLEAKVKMLEEQVAEQPIEFASSVNHKLNPSANSNTSSWENPLNKPLLKVDARVSGSSTIFIKIQCDNCKGMVVQLLSQIEKLKLIVTNSSIMPFGGSTLNVTVIALVEKGFSLTPKDVVDSLSSVVSQFM